MATIRFYDMATLERAISRHEKSGGSAELPVLQALKADMEGITNRRTWDGKAEGLFRVEIDFENGSYRIFKAGTVYPNERNNAIFEREALFVPEAQPTTEDKIGQSQPADIESPQPAATPDAQEARPQEDFSTQLFNELRRILGI